MAFEIEANDIIVVTGASGFVGSALVEALLEGPGRVRAVVRPNSPRSPPPRDRVEIAFADMRDPAAMTAAARGARFLFHVAADYRLWAPDSAALMTANVEGTRTVMTAARAAGVERIVYTSSVATLAPRPDGASADERDRLAESKATGAYMRSKIAAEGVVEALVSEGLEAVIVNPSTPLGPRDGRPTPTGRILVEAALGRIPAFVDTGLNLVHVDDVAQGHLAALAEGRTGERYILGGDNVLLSQMLTDIATLVGRPPPRLRLPRAPLFPFAMITEAVAHATGREPLLTLDGLRHAKHRMFFTAAKAERELGYRHRPYRAAIRDALEWFSRHGALGGVKLVAGASAT
jgi:dihydroflavonol-4-reductase